MKKLIYLTAVAGSLLLTTSCVDLTQEPESFITEEEYWNTVDQASLEKAADALYSDLWQGNYGFNSRLQRINVCADDITYEFLDLVEKNFKKYRQLDFYADKLCITAKYLSTTVKNNSGISASEWIKRYVILEAQRLLKNSSMTIQQISNELNFPSQTFFSKYFKHQIGLSPKEYRKS